MQEMFLLVAILFIALIILAVVLFLWLKRADRTTVDLVMKAFEDEMRAEFRTQRADASQQSAQLREELNGGYKHLSESLLSRMNENLTQQNL